MLFGRELVLLGRKEVVGGKVTQAAKNAMKK